MSLFYESVGALMTSAGEALVGRPDDDTDERRQRERRQVAVLVQRIGAIWPELFQALTEETKLLGDAAADLEGRLIANGAPVPEPPPEPAYPLLRHRWQLARIERAMTLLHDRADDPWADDALRTARRSLAAAAEVHGRLVDRALSTRPNERTRSTTPA